MKICPFCKVEMNRPRVNHGIGEGDKEAINYPCNLYHINGSANCEQCKRYLDWECPKCGILLFYRK